MSVPLFLVLSVVVLLLVPLVWLSLPRLVPQNSPLGVSVPQDHQDAPEVAAGWRRFHTVNFAVAATLFVVLIVVVLTAGEPRAEVALGALLGVQVLAMVPTWWWAGSTIRQAKEEQGWYKNARVEVLGSATAGEDASAMPHVPVPWPLYVLSYLLVGFTSLLIWLGWDSIPSMVEGFDSAKGEMVPKAVGPVFAPIFMTVGLVTVMLLVSLLVAFNPGRFRTNRSASARLRMRMLFEAMQQDLALVTVCYSLGFGLLSLQILPSFARMSGLVTFTGMALLLVPIVAFLAHLMRVSASVPAERGEADDPNLDKYYKAGLFYVNREDPALFVDRRAGVGLDMNWGNPKAVPVSVAILVVVLALVSVPLLFV